jgi:hypothetical protein
VESAFADGVVKAFVSFAVGVEAIDAKELHDEIRTVITTEANIRIALKRILLGRRIFSEES